MPIGIYTIANPSSLISYNSTFTNPLLVSLNGRLGGIVQKRLYLRNGDNTLYYSSITVKPSCPTDVTLIDGSRGLSWKLLAGSTQPTDEAWAAIAPANTISMPNLGSSGSPNTTTYSPFWVRVEIPRNIEVQTLLSVTLDIACSENLA